MIEGAIVIIVVFLVIAPLWVLAMSILLDFAFDRYENWKRRKRLG